MFSLRYTFCLPETPFQQINCTSSHLYFLSAVVIRHFRWHWMGQAVFVDFREFKKKKKKISTPESKLPHMPSGHWWLYPGFLDIKWLVLFCFVPETRYRHSHESQVMLWKQCLPEMPSALDIVSGSSHTHTTYHLLCLPVGCYLLFVCTSWMWAILEISIHLTLLKKHHYICHQYDFSTGSERLRRSPYLVLVHIWFCDFVQNRERDLSGLQREGNGPKWIIVSSHHCQCSKSLFENLRDLNKL